MALGTSTDSQSKYDTTNSATVPTGNKICNYDDFVDVIGEFGLWQKFVCFLLWFPAAAGGIHVLMYSFTGLAPDKFRSVIRVIIFSYERVSDLVFIFFVSRELSQDRKE